MVWVVPGPKRPRLPGACLQDVERPRRGQGREELHDFLNISESSIVTVAPLATATRELAPLQGPSRTDMHISMYPIHQIRWIF